MQGMKRFSQENVQDILALSPMQEGILFHYLADSSSDLYFEQLSLNISGVVDYKAFEKAWQFVVNNNEMLRTVFVWEKIKKPVQIILKSQKVFIRFHDLSGQSVEVKQRILVELKEKDRKEKFDLRTGPLFRVTLCKLDEECHEVIISNHHIIYDGWSNGVILKEFFEAYRELSQYKEPVAPIKNRFSSYIKWLKNQDKKRQEDFWHDYLKGFTTRTMLPTDYKSGEISTVKTLFFSFESGYREKVDGLIKDLKITLSTLFNAAWGLTLLKYNPFCSEDVLFGTTVSGRPYDISQIENMVGLFINTLPFRIKMNKDLRIEEFLHQVYQRTLEIQKFEMTPLAEIQSYSELSDKGQLFDSITVIENYPLNFTGEVGLSINSYSIFEMTNYNFTLIITPGQELAVRVLYNPEAFNEDTVKRIVQHYTNIIKEMIANPQKSISEISAISLKEKEMILSEFNSTAREYSEDKLVYEIFAERAKKEPDKIAIVFAGREYTYGEINEKSNQLTRYLREKGIGSGSIVGIMVERSVEMIVGILAIMKAGGAYLPIDPSHPEDRIKYMLEDSNSTVLLVQNPDINVAFKGQMVNLRDEKLYQGDSSDLEWINEGHNLAYVIYTSGSTGKPKGVMIEHRNLINILHVLQELYPLTPTDAYLLKTTFTFDVSVAEIFGWFMGGGRLVILEPGEEKDPRAIIKVIKEAKITHINFVPSMFNAFLSSLTREDIAVLNNLKYIFVAGEALSKDLVDRYNRSGITVNLQNLYGPTEGTIYTTGYSVKNLKEHLSVPIGKPLPNIETYILDGYGNLQPIGMPGELCIGGKGVARGYLNREELTREKFVENPYRPGEFMYRSGDLARWLPDGNIEYLGRIDHQVKIRGYRIELGEIENCLVGFEKIKEAVVIDREDKTGNKYLCGYYVSDEDISLKEIKSYLKKALPEYMIPAHFIKLEKMPLNLSGKIDRKALPAPETIIKNVYDYVSPADELEEKLAQIWAEILGVDKVGVKDNFFTLGGHSIKVIELVSRILKEFNVEISLKNIFNNPTIRELKKLISDGQKMEYYVINKAEEREYYPVSATQKRFFLLHQLMGDNTSYNISVSLILEGSADLARLEDTLQKLVQRHESLRTSFVLFDGEPVQKIEDQVNLEITYFKNKNELDGFIRPFDLAKAPLFRVGVLQDNNRLTVLFDMHHIIADGKSLEILLTEFAQIYSGISLPRLSVQYKDFAVWQREFLKSDVVREQEKYWLQKFSISEEELPLLDLPTDFKRPANMKFTGNKFAFSPDNEVSIKLKELASSKNTTLYMVLLAAYTIFLSKYTDQKDIIIGSPVVGRNHPETEGIMGLFINTLAMRNRIKGDETFDDFLEEVKINTLQALENQDYPFEELVEKLDLERNFNRNPLFDTLFDLQQGDGFTVSIPELKVRIEPLTNSGTKLDLALHALETKDGIEFDFQYSTELFKFKTIERMAKHFINLITQITENPGITIKDLDIILKEEKRILLFDFNNTYSPYPCEKTVQQIFAEQVRKTPDKIALVFEEYKITYKELDERANRLANLLISKGIRQDRIVGLLLNRTHDIIVAILGVLKAGGAFLPIDPAYPLERIDFLLKDSGTEILLTHKNLLLPVDCTQEKIYLDDEKTYTLKPIAPDVEVGPHNLCNVIYTSGSTGLPKGVMVEHRAVVNYGYCLIKRGEITTSDSTLLLLSYSFDGTYTNVWPALFTGAVLHVVSDECYRDPDKLLAYMGKNEITFTKVTPSLFSGMINCSSFEEQGLLNNLRLLIFGGEEIRVRDLEKYRAIYPQIQFMNHYGPTEATIGCMSYLVEKANFVEFIEHPVIGTPHDNMKVYILDENMKPVPIGVIGELCISGDSLARGYHNRPELNKEKFVENPFIPGEFMYKTGDLARWTEKGTVEFFGRKDEQIKIRGYRVEIGEIEKTLLKHTDIKEVVVIDKKDNSDERYLVAYYVSQRELTVGELRSFLSSELPEYMIPSYFVTVEKIPLRPGGKVDKKRLPDVNSRINTGREYISPQTEMETKLCAIWSEILGIQMIGIEDNFFELGGHSLKATMMVAKVKKELNLEIPLREVFKNPRIKDLATYLEGGKKSLYAAIPVVEEREYYPLSSAQKRLYLLNQISGESINYNMPRIMYGKGTFDITRLENVLKKIIKRHESLRTSFDVIKGEPVQIIHKKVELPLKITIAEKKDIDKLVDEFIRPFDLTKAPLFRVEVVKFTENCLLMFDMHHIISDGVSNDILIKELIELYQGEELNDLRIQYKDYAIWQNNLLNSDVLKRQEEYWMSIYGGEIPVLNMPTDFPRPSVMEFKGATCYAGLSKELSDGLIELGSKWGATLYMTLLAIYYVLLAKYTRQEDIIVGTPIAGRPHADLAGIIGMFANTLALRNYPQKDKTFVQFLDEVKEHALKGYENQDYQFEMLVEKLNLKRDLSRNPLFDTMFVLQDINPDAPINLANVTFTPYKYKNKITKFDLLLFAVPHADGINFRLEYSTSLFKDKTAERFLQHYLKLIENIVKHPELKISELKMITQKEQEMILNIFNDTEVLYPEEITLMEIFSQRVQKTPENPALICEDKVLTYAQFNEKTNQLARLLRSKGVRGNDIVGVLADRSPQMVIAVFAILKAGGAYLPMDPSYPGERIDYLLKDSGASILLTNSNGLPQINHNIEVIDLNDETLYSGDGDDLDNIRTPHDLAYVIYTSGSTGMPKGVLIEEKSVVNILLTLQNLYPLVEGDAYLLKTTYTFDVSVTELFGWFLASGKLVILEKGMEKDPVEIAKVIEDFDITHINFAPSMLNTFVNTLSEEKLQIINRKLKYLFVAGEAISKSLVERVNSLLPDVVFENIYGPTEATIYATAYSLNKIPDTVNVPIGKPLANLRIYIVDENLNLQPIGVPGEICIAGIGLARGYLNKPHLTGEKFVADPFVIGDMIYRTGDLGRWLEDGNIEYLGRIDYQVKIRGYRIEPGEIENCLLKHEDINEAVVIDLKDEAQVAYLCAYIVAKRELEPGELRAHLLKTLPDYMIPSHFVSIDELPLTGSGKIDRKVLPQLEGKVIGGSHIIDPEDETEEKLVKIWSEILNIGKIGVNQSFFEIGGHSLRATQLVAKIYKEFDVDIPLKLIFKHPTIREQGDLIKKGIKKKYSPINKIPEAEYYPASSAQKRIYFLNQLKKNDVSYNIPVVIEVKEKINRNNLILALEKLIQRHEALRTTFTTINDVPVQMIHSTVSIEMYFINTSDKNLEEIIDKFIRPFDLVNGPLFRVGLVEGTETAYLLFDIHHIIADGVSLDILVSDFINLYQEKVLQELTVQYKDFVYWQNEFFKSKIYKKQEEYWLNTLSGEIPVLDLPTDYPRPVEPDYRGSSIDFSWDKGLTEKLIKLARKNGITLYMLLLAIYTVLLEKYTEQKDILVGSPVAGRNHPDIENVVGMFVNTLVLRNYPESHLTFAQFLEQVKENTLQAFDNQDYQFEMLVEKLGLAKDLSRNPLFDTVFVLQSSNNQKKITDELRGKSYHFTRKRAKFDLTLNAEEMNGEIHFVLEYRTALFKQETIIRMSQHLTNIAEKIVRDDEVKLKELEIISEWEKEKILYEFNDTKVDYPENKTITQLFEEQVIKTPDKIALVYGAKSLTYRELNEKSNQLARKLRTLGVRADKAVGIMAERSLEMMIGVLAIVKAGGAYLPIDPDYPQKRIDFMLKDSKAEVLLTQREFSGRFNFIGKIIFLEDEDLYQGESTDLVPVNSPLDLIYIIYTSGSTGQAKGVMIEHRNVNRLISNSNMLIISEKERILQTGSLAFDASTFEIWGTFLNGATLYLLDKAELLSPERLEKKMKEYSITMMWMTAPLFNQMVEANEKIFTELKTLLVGGDVLSPKHINMVRKINPRLTVINGYGPTESTTFTTYFIIDRDYETNIPIGQPVSNTCVYILNRANTCLQPIGVVGELCIGGDGLARGYLNRPELTAERFVSNPVIPGERMYKTGDLARWLENGNIEFIGRVDYQIKIRGFRIELGEIEYQILKHEKVKEAVIIVKEDDAKNKHLVAYVVPDGELSGNTLRKYLMDHLPDYMVPSYFIFLEKLPLTTNGKIDRQALPEPLEKYQEVKEDYQAPLSETEKILARIWTEILGVQKISNDDNFFELGGHSLKATQLVGKILKEFGIEVPLELVFRNPTIKEIAHYINTSQSSGYTSIEKVTKREYYPLSSAQKRLMFLAQLDNSSIRYNISGALEITGNLNKTLLEEAIYTLIKRHEALRTGFEFINGEPVQRIYSDVPFKIDYFTTENEQVDEILRTYIRPFVLKNPPLFRVGLIEDKERCILVFDLHHIISDGFSMDILTREFIQLYQGKKLSELKVQYKDFAFWQNNFFESEEFAEQKAYWLKIFGGEIPVLNLPTDYPKRGEMDFSGDRLTFTLPEELTKKVYELALKQEVTLYMLLLACYNVLLAKYTGQEDIVVGSPIAGRRRDEMENVVGMFVNTLPVRNYPQGKMKFSEFLRDVKHNTLKAYENQDMQFEMLIEELKLTDSFNFNPLVKTIFAVQNAHTTSIVISGLEFKFYPVENKTAKFDLSMHVFEEGQTISVSVEYSTRLYKKSTIKRITEHFVNVINQIIIEPDRPISQVEVISEEERRKLLIDFNDTKRNYPGDKTIPQLLIEVAEKYPNKIALFYKEESLTYKELVKKAAHIKRLLQQRGISPGKIVGMFTDKSLEMIIGIMGILMAGGTYLPIDPQYPEERIKFMLEDSQADLILTQNHLLSVVKEYGREIVDLNDAGLYQGNISEISIPGQTGDIVYIIYTSGSTGKPKGILTTHYNIVRVVKNTNYINITPDDRLLQLSNYVFDGSTIDIYGSLLNGASLYIIPKEKMLDLDAFKEFVHNNKISVTFMTTAFFNTLVENCIECFDTMRKVLFGGERASFVHVKKAFEYLGPDRLINGYGPTETTVFATYYPVDMIDEKLGSVPIGKPLTNTEIYILDKNNNLAPIGVIGELCVSGDGLAKGYLNRPDLTAEKFVENPFKPGELMYRTGDLARWLEDGNIEFIERIDHQVKIRGFRIELGEIEASILSYPQVSETTVVVKEDDLKNKYLCAYLVIKPGEEFSPISLKNYLSKKLPQYMIPAYFVRLEKMPLTPNGKINIRALPEPEVDKESGKEYVAPANEYEQKLSLIWSEILGVEKISSTDDFFEIGGHSLRVAKLAAKIKLEFGVEIPLKLLFQKSGLKEMAQYIAKADKSYTTTIPKVEKRTSYPLSSAQRRLYLIYQLKRNSISFNMPVAFIIEGNFDWERFVDSFTHIIKRHQTLRTSITLEGGEPVQKIHPEVDFRPQLIEVNDRDLAKEELNRQIKDFVKPFDLSQPPLFRVKVLKYKEKYLFLFDIHHIVSDGVSIDILLQEFASYYENIPLPDLAFQYTDYAVWQRKFFESNEIKLQEKYWLDEVKDLNYTQLPKKGLRDESRGQSGEALLVIEEELYKKVKEYCQSRKITRFSLLLTLFKIVLYKKINQSDLSIGIPIAGRNRTGLNDLIGLFLNVLVVRSKIDDKMSFKDYLNTVYEKILKAQENQDYPYEELYAKVKEIYQFSGDSLFSILFNYMPQLEGESIKLKDITITPCKIDGEAKYDLTLYIRERTENMTLHAVYRKDVHEDYLIEKILEDVKTLLQLILNNDEILISEIEFKGQENLKDFDEDFEDIDLF